MQVRYLLNNQEKVTDKSNDDLLFVYEEKKENHIVKVVAKKEIRLLSAVIEENFEINNNDLYFLNGYQSWTDTHLIKPEKYKEINLHSKAPRFMFNILPVDQYGDSRFYKYGRNKLHSYDIFYTQGENEVFVLSNNYKNAYLIIEILKKADKLNLISDCKNVLLKEHEEFVLYDYVKFNSYREGKEYFDKKYPLRKINKIFGYTSWYNYYQNINEEIILRDLDALDNRFNMFQIDDGYETFVGDWKDVDQNKFPNGLKGIVDKIHQKGYKAGVWLAPFVAEKKSKLFRERPDLFKKDKKGNPIQVGINWSGQYLLDIEDEEAVKYIKESLQYHMDLGFDLFKLDFLYSLNDAEYDVSRAQITQKGYELLKEILKDKMILGCGATLFNCYDNFDYLRIGMDASLSFDDAWWMRGLHRERPTTKSTLQNTIFRSFMDQRLFANDPDVFLLRDNNIKFSKEQKRAMTTINALFGSVLMTSDDIATYDEDAKKVLDHALNVFKDATDKQYQVDGEIIHISYKLNGKDYSFDYSIKKGVMLNER